MLNIIEGKKNIFVADVRAEKLFREAEDDFFYFNNFDAAIEKIEKALTFVPKMLKALMMRANIYLLDGNFDDAMKYYELAQEVAPNNPNVLAALANIYELNSQNEKALIYVDKALNALHSKYNPLNKALIDLKITILIKQKKYLQAQLIINQSKSFLSLEDYRDIYVNNNSILKQKLELQRKIKQNNLKLIK